MGGLRVLFPHAASPRPQACLHRGIGALGDQIACSLGRRGRWVRRCIMQRGSRLFADALGKRRPVKAKHLPAATSDGPSPRPRAEWLGTTAGSHSVSPLSDPPGVYPWWLAALAVPCLAAMVFAIARNAVCVHQLAVCRSRGLWIVVYGNAYQRAQ